MNNINKYLKNKLPDTEAEKITKTILVNAFTKELKEDWSKVLEEQYKILPPQKKRTNYSIYRIAAVAASILFLAMIGQHFIPSNTPNYQELLASHIKKLYPSSQIRKGDTPLSREEAYNAYISGKYSQAIQYWKEIINSGKGDIIDYFFLGLCYFYNGQYQSAILTFRDARSKPTTNTFPSKDGINWHLSLAYLKAEQLDLAKEELERIVNEDQDYNAKAKELLKALNKKD